MKKNELLVTMQTISIVNHTHTVKQMKQLQLLSGTTLNKR